MRVTILTEGFQHTGYGHIFRCQAIAGVFRKRGVEVSFIIHGDDQLKEILADYEISLFPWLADSARLKESLNNTDIALIDSYHADEDVYQLIFKNVGVCACIDDFDRLHYPPGILINGTVGADLIYEKRQKDVEYLIGGDYVILREPFRKLPVRETIAKNIHTILITFGGSDPLRLTPEIMSKIVEFYPLSRKIIILGPAFKNVEEVEQLADIHTQFYRNVDAETMKELMSGSDIALSAAGQTINELAATGLPSIIFKIADNQKFNIAGWINAGYMDHYLDAITGWPEDELKESLQRLEDPEERRKRSLIGQQTIDGKGAERIVKGIFKLFGMKFIEIRAVQDTDLLPLFELANDKDVRTNSFTSDPIPFVDHTRWFTGSLRNPLRKLYVFYLSGNLVGQVRFDQEEEEKAVVSISLVAFYRGMGLASWMIRRALEVYYLDQPEVRDVFAYVKMANTSSQYTFINAGFDACASELNEVLKYRYTYEK